MGYLVSTKGRYALRTMLDLAEHPEGTVPLKDIADRQEISLKYLETIMPCLKEAGLVVGTHGKGGGYRLTRPPDQYTVGEILKVSEGTIAPIACLGGDLVCSRQEFCQTLPMWKKLDGLISGYLDTVKLTDMMSPADGPALNGGTSP